MGHYKTEIIRAAKDNAIECIVLGRDTLQGIKNDLIEMYGTRGYGYLSDSLNDPFVIYTTEGWHWIHEIIRNEPVILFFNGDDEQEGFLINHPQDFDVLIGDSFGMRFYVTNQALEYVVAMNDHDYLIVAGIAKDWLQDFLARKQHESIRMCLAVEGIRALELDSIAVQSITQRVWNDFTLPPMPILAQALRAIPHEAIRVVDPWLYVEDVLDDEPLIVFFDDAAWGYHVGSLADCQTVINALFVHECYVVNAAMEYVASIDHQKYFTVVGVAMPWMREFKDEHSLPDPVV